MSPREETEEEVCPPETPLCGQDETKAQSPELQRPDSPGLCMPEKNSWSTDSFGLSDLELSTESNDSSTSSVSIKSDRSKSLSIEFSSSHIVSLDILRSESTHSDRSQDLIENFKGKPSSWKKRLQDRFKALLCGVSFRGRHRDT